MTAAAHAGPARRRSAPPSLVRCLFVAAVAAAAAAGAAGQPEDPPLEDDLIAETGLEPEALPETRTPRLARSRLSSSAAADQARPFQIAFVNNLTAQSPEVEAFIISRLMPAAGRILARSIQVRDVQAGLITVTGTTSFSGAPYPQPPGGAVGYDADLVIQVGSVAPERCTARPFLAAQAGARYFVQSTGRPVIGEVNYCEVTNDFVFELQTATHEILHVLGVSSRLFSSYQGYPGSIPVTFNVSSGALQLQFPQVLATARTFFDCPTLAGVPLENTGGGGTAGSHWEERIFEGHLMDAIEGQRSLQTHNNRHVLTDLSLALLQDSGWYNVLYGSQGFSSYGYQGTCAFASGTFAQALQEPRAARYLCPSGQDVTRLVCGHDHSVAGICLARSTSDGFVTVFEAVISSATADLVNCQGVARGSRCLETPRERLTSCVDMRCSDSNTVLINGEPCNSGTFNCPSDEEMCVNPGYLTCVGALNDCSGNGDCFQGRCFCHLGFGGDDCSVEVCIDACPDGSPCPRSGFCGVPECGAFTTGATDRGTPCNSAAAVVPSPPSPAAAPAPAPLPSGGTPTPPTATSPVAAFPPIDYDYDYSGDDDYDYDYNEYIELAPAPAPAPAAAAPPPAVTPVPASPEYDEYIEPLTPAPVGAPQPQPLPPRDTVTPPGAVPPFVVVILVRPTARGRPFVFVFSECGEPGQPCCVTVLPFVASAYCFGGSTCDTESFLPRCRGTATCGGLWVGTTCNSPF